MDGLEVELRVVAGDEHPVQAEDVFGGAGPWVGETTDGILELMHDFRQDDGSEPPHL